MNAALLHRRICFSQAGNVVTGEMVEELILAGADIIKVGIGPGEGRTAALDRIPPHLSKHTSPMLCPCISQVLFAPPARRRAWGTPSSAP